jgi:hypothetical protein
MPVPQFKDLGKKAKDLFKKQYDFKNEIKVVSTAAGVKLESGGSHAKGLVGYTKANWKDDYLGDVEVEAHSCGLAKGQFKLANVADGVNLTVSGCAAGSLNLEANYVQDCVSATAKAGHNLNKGSTSLSASAVFGFDGVSVGGQVDLDASGSPKDYNVGAQYAAKDLVAALVTSNKGDDITISFHQKVSCCYSMGASMLVKPESGSRAYTFGTDYCLDKNTSIKAKAGSCGTVGVAVSHKLADPKVKLGISAQFNALSDDIFKAQKFGICMNFGEF